MGIQVGLTFALKIIAPPLQIRFIDKMYKLSAFYNKQIKHEQFKWIQEYICHFCNKCICMSLSDMHLNVTVNKSLASTVI